mmetsp:Transcript_10507/g.23543  ORF Transcript_10507/g.23543 Transcript_10507/m.23543 type:complete len:277 (-) Transcript_10507:243-1073(-)
MASPKQSETMTADEKGGPPLEEKDKKMSELQEVSSSEDSTIDKAPSIHEEDERSDDSTINDNKKDKPVAPKREQQKAPKHSSPSKKRKTEKKPSTAESNTKSPEKSTEKVETEQKTTKKKKFRSDVQDKILAFFGQELATDRTHVTKKEVAEGCGFASPGTHGFFYAWQDLEKEKKFVAKDGKGPVFHLTDLGKKNIPKGVVLTAHKVDNAGKQEQFLKILVKQCHEAKADKMKLCFDILSDGKVHGIDEFTETTGYANLKSKGLGYAFTHMEKKM